MNNRFSMKITDFFKFQDGRTVLTGPIDDGREVLLQPGPCEILVDGHLVATVEIHPELPLSRMSVPERSAERAVGTRDDTKLTRELVLSQDCRLEGNARYRGHRHLLGIDSPPKDFVPDGMTYGPVLPEGWDGDAWEGRHSEGYFLRAWNKRLGRYAIGTGEKYEEARKALCDEIASGGRAVRIEALEQVL
jgi:hypothetical protein